MRTAHEERGEPGPGPRRRGVVRALAAGGVLAAGAATVPFRPAATPARASEVPPGARPLRARWRTRNPLPVARAEVAVAALGGRVYVVGGTTQRDGEAPVWATTTVHAYDPRRDRWTERAPLPRPLTHVGVAALDGRLYAFGGFTTAVHLNPQPDAYVYDPRRDRWHRLPDMPEALGSVGVAAVGGRLHLLGGRDSRRVVTPPGSPVSLGMGTVRSHHVYDPRRRTYAPAPPLPGDARDHAGVAVLGGRVHVVGGRVEDIVDNLTRHDVYDAARRTWSRAAPLPVARSAGAAVVLDGRLVYAGGECRPGADDGTGEGGGGGTGAGGGTYGDVTVYDPRAGRWDTVAGLPGSRHGFGAAALDGRAYFTAGSPDCGGGASTGTLQLALHR
ncbi:kelch-like protein [Streptomyces sp. Z26]|uniref:Kelch repeat-containing protein n=1 Tax=Streptomyces sp. Z26 TaxID=2500177 RepID=UPI000EF159B6|nr:kelch-like protein [Streptomyces sp. Z26]RLL68063.1 kelch-like protein [Streptomyces sp. Z26]